MEKKSSIAIEDVYDGYNYSELVANYMKEHNPDWRWFERTIEKNFLDGNGENSDDVTVYVMELINANYGWKITREFCGWFGIKYDDDADMESVMWDYEKLEAAFTYWLDYHKPDELKGNFIMMNHEGDGSLCLWYVVPKEEKRFSTWRKEEGYKSWDEFYNDELTEGKEAEDIRDEYDGIIDEYKKACEDNHWLENMDEE